jgi:hypothetical protein
MGIQLKKVEIETSFTLHPAFTDAWHFFKSLMIVLLCSALVFHDLDITFFGKEWMNLCTELLIYGTVWNATFSLFYETILKR